MRLSIITPYYNCLNRIKNLAQKLQPQLNEEVEWIIIDDGCHEKELDDFKAIIIHLQNNSGCAGIPRNYGLNIAKGDYITFIDADDLVASTFVKKILDKINKTTFDYCFMSWHQQDGLFSIDATQGRPDWNCSVWGVVYKAENLKNIRFNNKRFAEDFDFNEQALKGKQETIPEYLYYYASNENGLSSQQGGVNND